MNYFAYLQNEALVIIAVVGVDWNATDDSEGLVGLVDGAAVLEAFGLP